MISDPVLKVSSQNTPEITEATQRRRLVSLTPLIDVVFILLIFFLLTLTLSEFSAIPLSVSTQAAGGTGSTDKTALLLKLGLDRTVEVDGQRIDIDEAAAVLEKLYQRDPGLTLVIRSESGVSIQQLVNFTDKLAKVGITDISLTQ